MYRDSSGNTSEDVITQTLQKEGLFRAWSTYTGDWTKTTDGRSASLSNKVYKLASGTYRVKTVFTVTDTITVYSSESKIQN